MKPLQILLSIMVGILAVMVGIIFAAMYYTILFIVKGLVFAAVVVAGIYFYIKTRKK